MSGPIPSSLLVVDDEPSLHIALRELLGDVYTVCSAHDAEDALERLHAERFDCILLDLSLPGMDGLTFLTRVRDRDIRTPVIILTATTSVPSAVRAMRLGAEDYITKPWEPDGLRLAVARAVERARLFNRMEAYEAARPGPVRLQDIVSRSPAMQEVVDLARRMSQNDSRVLLTGETGTGKELLARAIHDNGPRQKRPFLAVNCAAVPAELAESELFGHEKGAFTGAHRAKRGCFELAHEGTLFLDEITCLPVDLQPKFLRVLQDGAVQRVGSEAAVRVDGRVIAATNADIRVEVAAGRFREDLFYRLNVVPIHIPPLRDRPEDVPALLDHFLAVFNRRFHKRIRGYVDECRTMLCRYPWPGNVRELQHTIERLVILEEGETVTLRHLPIDIVLAGRNGAVEALSPGSGPLRKARDQFEREYIVDVLVRSEWNQSRAATLLGISRNTLIAKLHQYKIMPYDSPKPAR